jgi:hypothetical protein
MAELIVVEIQLCHPRMLLMDQAAAAEQAQCQVLLQAIPVATAVKALC